MWRLSVIPLVLVLFGCPPAGPGGDVEGNGEGDGEGNGEVVGEGSSATLTVFNFFPSATVIGISFQGPNDAGIGPNQLIGTLEPGEGVEFVLPIDSDCQPWFVGAVVDETINCSLEGIPFTTVALFLSLEDACVDEAYQWNLGGPECDAVISDSRP